MTDREYGAGVLDGLELCRLAADVAAFEGDPVAYIRRKVETVQLELAYVASPDEEGNEMALADIVRRRDNSPTVAQIAAAEATLQRRQRDRDEAAERLGRELATADEALATAAERLDAARRRRIGECAQAWRARAEQLRERIAATPAEATEARVVTVKQLFAPPVHEQRVRPVREWLELELADVDKRARNLERLAGSDESGERLADRVERLTWPGGGDAGA